MDNTIKGSIVAIVTPMYPDGSIDWISFQNLLDWHLAEGTDGIVICGTTGECSTLSIEERCQLMRFSVEYIKGQLPIISYTGGNSTTEAVNLTTFAKNIGIHSSLQIVPYYNKPTQEGLYLHFRTIAEKVDLPLILYNVPSRTVVDMSNDTILKLAQIPGIVGIKDATGDLQRVIKLMKNLEMINKKDFSIYSGDDLTSLFLMLIGGSGTISVTANIVPKLMHIFCTEAMIGNFSNAWKIHNNLFQLHQSMFLETNPIPVKWTLQRMKKISSGIRLPLTKLSQTSQDQINSILDFLGIS